MTNKAIAKLFDELAKLMELHGENSFKIRSYQNAYITIRKLEDPLAELSDDQIIAIPGVGKAIAEKIREAINTGTFPTLEKFREITPNGVVDLLKIDGLGPKKVDALWKDLEIESPGELLYACNENRLVVLKGFGEKTQTEIKKKTEYYLASKNKFLYKNAAIELDEFISNIQQKQPDLNFKVVGEMRRKLPVVNSIELLVVGENANSFLTKNADILLEAVENEHYIKGKSTNGYPIIIYFCAPNELGSKLFKYTGPLDYINQFVERNKNISFKDIDDENQIFVKSNTPFLNPVLRDGILNNESWWQNPPNDLIEIEQIKGIVHNHSTYSDGIHTLKEMADYVRSSGFEYFVITDHSKSAFYANGLKEDMLLQQIEEIKKLNETYTNFKIFSGIESDILWDGQLDYADEILNQLDVVVASVHSILKMDIDKATERLIKAIEHPATRILGHPTGRLLLSREGYPINHKKVIDACAANNVVIEVNANPLRLDIDWQWIPYCTEKGVKISINPDAHNKTSIHDIKYGVYAAQKGGLTKSNCLNTKNLQEFSKWVESKKS